MYDERSPPQVQGQQAKVLHGFTSYNQTPYEMVVNNFTPHKGYKEMIYTGSSTENKFKKKNVCAM